MFNLIVAVLSIALIGITAGASVYYGGAAEPQGTDLDIANGHVVPGFLPGNQVTFACITKPWGGYEGGIQPGRYFIHRI